MDAARRAGESKTARMLGDRICYLVEALSSLKLKEKRGEYFKHVETLRAQGLSTQDTPAALGDIRN
jgi:hypothetical protein